MPEGLLSADRHVVSPVHVRILEAVADAEKDYGSLDLRLEGGTALSAYYLIHRQSEDLDLFGSPGMDARDFRAFVEEHLSRRGFHVVGRGPANQGSVSSSPLKTRRFRARSASGSKSAPSSR